MVRFTSLTWVLAPLSVKHILTPSLIFRVAQRLFQSVRGSDRMHSHARWSDWTFSRLRIPDVQGPQDREYCHGQGTLPGRQDRMYLYCATDILYLPLYQIDPKRAIPRDEQEKTSKIFVGGVSQEAGESDFREYFMQFGRVLDATLMMDKDTGRPRGFGFVTFDSESAVENALNCPSLEIMGKPVL